MATTQTSATRAVAPRHSRLSEIVAIALLTVGVLLVLCLAPGISYDPNDPSWNASGQSETHNLIGPVGANVAAALYQFFGLAAFLVPALLFAVAWRLFRKQPVQTPKLRLVGLMTLVLSCAALLTLFGISLLFDRSIQPGGLAGKLIADALSSGLNTTGAIVLLFALAATGILLATNFSFSTAYETLAVAFDGRFDFITNFPERFRAWRTARRARAHERAGMRRELRAEREREELDLAEAYDSSIIAGRPDAATAPTAQRITTANTTAAAAAAATAIKRAAAVAGVLPEDARRAEIEARLALEEAELADIALEVGQTPGTPPSPAREKSSRRGGDIAHRVGYAARGGGSVRTAVFRRRRERG